MSGKQRRQPVIRFVCLYVAYLLPNAVNANRRPNDGRLAMIEVLPRQDIALPSGERHSRPIRHEIEDSPAFDKMLHGVYAKAGSMQAAMGALVNFPSCAKDDEEFQERKREEDWIALMQYAPPEPTSDSAANGSGCLFVLDRVKKAMLFGASAIIILTMNPNILQQLDVALLLRKPVVVVDDLGNLTGLLGALNRVLKLKVKVTHGPSLYETQANSTFFWSYFFSALSVIIILLVIKCGSLLYEREENWDDKSIGISAWQQLSCLKIKRYRKALCKYDDSERDTCAICLDHFYQRQKIRILPCTHEFHTKCIDPWLVRRPFCPLCKTNVLELKHFGNVFQNSGW